jgi:predicted site-specific integrase-resolvase
MNNETKYWTPKELSDKLNIDTETLRVWEIKGKIKATKTEGGHRRYIYNESTHKIPGRKIIYARVSSSKQKLDLERQVNLLQSKYPNYEVVKDIGSGLNFNRRGFSAILESVFEANVQQIVVAHKDRLCRFGFDLLEKFFKRQGVTLTILSNDDTKDPNQELTDDLLSIITFFTARYYGSRKYTIFSETKDLPKPKSNRTIQQMPRRIKVLLQQRRSKNGN